MITAVDANVIIDVLSGDERFADPSARSLHRCAREGRVVSGGSALVEILTGFDEPDVGLARVAAMGVHHLALNERGALAAARARQRARAGGVLRERLLPDFLIGGHALAQADRLLTRDGGFYRRWFRDLKVVDPTEP